MGAVLIFITREHSHLCTIRRGRMIAELVMEGLKVLCTDSMTLSPLKLGLHTSIQGNLAGVKRRLQHDMKTGLVSRSQTARMSQPALPPQLMLPLILRGCH